jgi:hypothetical protein
MGDNKKSWDSMIKHALWANKITKKESISKIPFEIIYGVAVSKLNDQSLKDLGIPYFVAVLLRQGCKSRRNQPTNRTWRK